MKSFKICAVLCTLCIMCFPVAAQENDTQGSGTIDLDRMADQMKFEQGKYFYQLEKYQLAKSNLQEYLELFLHGAYRAEAYRMIANIYFDEFRYDRAAEVYRSLLEEYPGTEPGIRGMYKMGICYQKMGDTLKAADIFSRLIKEYPSSSYAHHSRVMLDVMKIVSNE